MQTFTTKVAADAAGVHQQTVIRWAVQGLVKPSVPRRKWEPRKYTERDLAALMLAKVGLSVGFDLDSVVQMVICAQKFDDELQRDAAILVIKGSGEFEGFVQHCWMLDVTDPEQAEKIKVLGEEERILQQVSLYDIVQGLLKTVHERYVIRKSLTPRELSDRL
jgi:DNA-binding transcriptional MerR regulator